MKTCFLDRRGHEHEKDEQPSREINVLGTKRLIGSLQQHLGNDFIFLFISTDLVYPGSSTLDTVFCETDALKPVSVYAGHKVEVENLLKESVSNYIIVRGPFIYGLPALPDHSSVKSFFLEMIEKLKKGIAVHLFEDEFRTPCYINDALDIIVNSALKFVDCRGMAGSRVFNLTSGHTISRFEFGKVRISASI